MEPTINTDPTPMPTPDQPPMPGAGSMNNIVSPNPGTLGTPDMPAVDNVVSPNVGAFDTQPVNDPVTPDMAAPVPPVAPDMGSIPAPGVAAPGPNPMMAPSPMQPSPASQFAGSMQMNQIVANPVNGAGLGGTPVSPALSAAGMLNDTEPITMPTPPKAPDPVEMELKAPIKAAAPVPGSIGSAISVPGDPNTAVGTEFNSFSATGQPNAAAPKKKSFFSGLFGKH